MSDRSKRKDIVRIVVTLVTFCVIFAALGVSRSQKASGDSWAHTFVLNVSVLLAMATPVAMIAIFSLRDRGDRMPAGSWIAGRSPLESSVQTYETGRAFRVEMVVIHGSMMIAAPFFFVVAVSAGLGVTIFVVLWTVLMIFSFRYWRKSFPSRLTLTTDELRVRTFNGVERSVPIAAISEIRWPYWGNYVLILHHAGAIRVPKYYVKGADDLVVELRHRNPAILYRNSFV